MFEEKMLVEFYNGNVLIKKKKYPIRENRVEIEKSKEIPGGAGYKPEFKRSYVIFYHEGKWPFRKLKQKLMMQVGSNQFMKMTKKGLDANEPSRLMIKEFSKAEVVKSAGATMQKLQTSSLLYILIFVDIMVSIAALLFGSGMIRFAPG